MTDVTINLLTLYNPFSVIIRHWTPLGCFFVCADINLTADALGAKRLTDLFRPMSCDGSGSSGRVVLWCMAEATSKNKTLLFVTTVTHHLSTTWKSGRTPMTRAFGSYLDCTTFQVKRSDFCLVVSTVESTVTCHITELVDS